MCVFFFFFFKQKTAYEMRISDLSSDVCSSDLVSACNTNNGDNYTLAGHIDNGGQSGSVMLYEGETLIDSIAVDKNGNFSMTGTTPEPILLEVRIEQQSYMLVLGNGENVELQVDMDKPEIGRAHV